MDWIAQFAKDNATDMPEELRCDGIVHLCPHPGLNTARAENTPPLDNPLIHPSFYFCNINRTRFMALEESGVYSSLWQPYDHTNIGADLLAALERRRETPPTSNQAITQELVAKARFK